MPKAANEKNRKPPVDTGPDQGLQGRMDTKQRRETHIATGRRPWAPVKSKNPPTPQRGRRSEATASRLPGRRDLRAPVSVVLRYLPGHSEPYIEVTAGTTVLRPAGHVQVIDLLLQLKGW